MKTQTALKRAVEALRKIRSGVVVDFDEITAKLEAARLVAQLTEIQAREIAGRRVRISIGSAVEKGG